MSVKEEKEQFPSHVKFGLHDLKSVADIHIILTILGYRQTFTLLIISYT